MPRTQERNFSKQARIIAGALAQAVAHDEQTEGCDISAGLFGPEASALLECLARELVNSTGSITRFTSTTEDLKDGTSEPRFTATR